jgi:hypothetical protein
MKRKVVVTVEEFEELGWKNVLRVEMFGLYRQMVIYGKNELETVEIGSIIKRMTKSLIYEMVENKIIFIRDFIEEKVRGNK